MNLLYAYTVIQINRHIFILPVSKCSWELLISLKDLKVQERYINLGQTRGQKPLSDLNRISFTQRIIKPGLESNSKMEGEC